MAAALVCGDRMLSFGIGSAAGRCGTLLWTAIACSLGLGVVGCTVGRLCAIVGVGSCVSVVVEVAICAAMFAKA